MKTALFYTKAIVLVFCLSFSVLNAQNYFMDGTPITDCNGFFEDSGGYFFSYGVNENFTTTICSDQDVQRYIQLDFPNIDIGEGETFKVYDAATADPAFELDTAFLDTPNIPFSLRATIANPSGCLTIVFTSDDIAGGNDGWQATISCKMICQIITADFTTIPEEMPIDTGWVDICLGDTIAFLGYGIYPQNGLAYIQNDTLSLFEWTFGDGRLHQGIHATNVYEEPGIYFAQLKIMDQVGCENSNVITQGIRVDSYSTFINDGSLAQTICSGDTIRISSSLDTLVNANISVVSHSGYGQLTVNAAEPLVLPDGTGASYTSSLNITQFEVGTSVTSASDIFNVSLAMEHSYSGDLDIELICPNGSSVYILDLDSGMSPGSTNFGEPFASSPVDWVSWDLTLGIPYTYTFVEDAVNGILDEFSANAPSYTYTTVPSQETGEMFTYTDRYFPEGIYQSEHSFSNLIGCPFNGEWTIRIQDNLAIDNGWLTEWSITFAEDLYTDVETFTPTIVDGGWADHPSIIATGQHFLLASPTGPDTVGYTFWALNDFGCLSDTTLQFNILSSRSAHCSTTAPDIPTDWSIMVYPNPVQTEGFVNISDDRKELNPTLIYVEVFNVLGELVFVKPIINGKLTYSINMSSLPVGVYYLRLRGDKEASALKKVIKL